MVLTLNEYFSRYTPITPQKWRFSAGFGQPKIVIFGVFIQCQNHFSVLVTSRWTSDFDFSYFCAVDFEKSRLYMVRNRVCDAVVISRRFGLRASLWRQSPCHIAVFLFSKNLFMIKRSSKKKERSSAGPLAFRGSPEILHYPKNLSMKKKNWLWKKWWLWKNRIMKKKYEEKKLWLWKNRIMKKIMIMTSRDYDVTRTFSASHGFHRPRTQFLQK